MNDLFLRACRGEPVERTPVWLMRQAGRSLPEYRKLRERHGFATLMRTPELAVEVTLQPVDRLDVDAAIVFSDILVPAECLGCRVEFTPGPVLDRPLDSAERIDSLRDDDPEECVGFVYETLRLLRRGLDGRVPLIGFAATPFTLAAYLVEGRGNKGFPTFKRMLFGEPQLAHRLLDAVCRVTERYVEAQVRAGAQAIQLFDSWVGLLGQEEFRTFDLPYTRRVFERLGTAVPRIYFGLDAAHLLEAIGGCGADVIGVDWRLGLDEAARRIGRPLPLQGNLDPSVLLAPPDVVAKHTRAVLERARGLPGHVFNLGHGVLPSTPVDNLKTLVETVRLGPGAGNG